jgi:hypothetical protein
MTLIWILYLANKIGKGTDKSKDANWYYPSVLFDLILLFYIV